MNTENENVGEDSNPNVGPETTPAPPQTEEEKIKDAVDSAPLEENGYVQPTSAAELSYEKELASRIEKSNFEKTVIAHKDFVKLNAAGLVDFETKALKSGQQLVISENPESPTGSYWDEKTFIK